MKTEEQKQVKPPRALKMSIIVIVVVVIGYLGVTKIIHSLNYENTDNAQIETNAVPVISRIPGYISEFELSDYQSVKEGRVLAVIDQSEYLLAVKQAEADLLAAKADLANAISQLPTIISDKDVAAVGIGIEEVSLSQAKRDMIRDESLYKEGSITLRQLERSQSAYQTAMKMVASSKSKLHYVSQQTGSANAQIEHAKATIAAREVALEKAKLNLSYTHILAPTSGKIGKTNLKKGQYVQGGQQLFSVVNNDKYWITANFKETQIEKMKVGMPVEIIIDGYPDKEVKGKITGFSDATGAKFSLLPPDNSTGNFVKVTQRVPVIIAIENANELQGILKAGLSVDVDVKVN
jgi:membrane fusion protein (multidrug efflux system)